MKPGGVILTYMVWTNWKSLPFNLSLFLFQLAFLIVGKIIGKVEVKWSEIWHAAQVSHIRLCLEPITPLYGGKAVSWRYINFGYPKAEIKPWRIDQCDDSPFEYRNPTFETSDRFIAAMIEYAEAQVGKLYDTLQLLSYGLNFFVWLFYWKWWGREVFRWLNLRGALEVCSSGITADLRWAEAHSNNMRFKTLFDTDYFRGYDTAMVSPCLIAIDENWREK